MEIKWGRIPIRKFVLLNTKRGFQRYIIYNLNEEPKLSLLAAKAAIKCVEGRESRIMPLLEFEGFLPF